jgi:hypothetical protein
MLSPIERRQAWSRIIGVERRAAPIQDLDGRPLPDPTLLKDEECVEGQRRLDAEKRNTGAHIERWDGSSPFD